MSRFSDVLVVGAGVFGAWIALQLRRTGRSVILADSFGSGNTRSSSSGATRVMRVGYGAEMLYSRWAQRSFYAWQRLFRDWRQELFTRTGVLWMTRTDDPASNATIDILTRLHVPFDILDRVELQRRYPQFRFGLVDRGVLEQGAGVILARRAVQMVVRQAIKQSVDYRVTAVSAPTGRGRVASVVTSDGDTLSADTFIFACGSWLPKLFPAVLGNRIHPTRQVIFFFGAEPGDRRIGTPEMPVWLDQADGVYGVPDMEGRGLKIGMHRHGPPFDPDSGGRITSEEDMKAFREILARRLPSLQHAPVLEARVCHYANSWNGDFLIDRHPEHDNVWLVGAGSGHGFKHGPMVGEYLAAQLSRREPPEERFTLAGHQLERARSIF